MTLRLASIILLGTALANVPSSANDSVSINLTGTIAPSCLASAFVRQTAGVNSTAIGIGYDVNTQVVGATSANSQVRLDTPGPQLIADLTARCNTPSASMRLQSDNNFRLVNGPGGTNSEVPFQLNLLGNGGASGISSEYVATINGTGPGPLQQQVRPLQFVLPTLIAPINLVPGTYSDTIRVTITPNP